ncbi:MAG: ABC transporter permease [Myxococcota bacterium]
MRNSDGEASETNVRPAEAEQVALGVSRPRNSMEDVSGLPRRTLLITAIFAFAAFIYAGSLSFYAQVASPTAATSGLFDSAIEYGYRWALAWINWWAILGPATALLAAAAALALYWSRRLGRSAPARTRLATAAGSALIHCIASCTSVSLLLFTAGTEAIQQWASFSSVPLLDLGPAPLPAPRALEIAHAVLVPISLSSLLVCLSALASCWSLLPPFVRSGVVRSLDAALFIAFVFVSIAFPLLPNADSAGIWAWDSGTEDESSFLLRLASIRLAVSILFAGRLGLWCLPIALNLIENTNFGAMVAARHLRAKKSGFLTTIGTLSILAVAFSSCSLTTTLSVMGGFRDDLKQKILGNNAHVVVQKGRRQTFDGWSETLVTVKETNGVVGATPVLTGEVMLSSATNLAGALLRGIDPISIDSVSDLKENLVCGKLDYLSRPALLLEIDPEERGSAFRPCQRSSWLPKPVESSKAQEDKRLERSGRKEPAKLGDAINTSSSNGLDIRSILDLDRDEFFRSEPEVLPGIVVGQELARVLRLYVGDEVNVVSPFGDLGPSGPMPKSRPFRVAGIFYSGMYEYDMKHAYITLHTAQGFLGTGDTVSRIEVKVEDVDRAPETAAQVRNSLSRVQPELLVQDWQEVNQQLFGALALEKLAMFITLGIAIMVAGFCVFGTLTLMVQEKSREVGILQAMGTTKRSIVAIFLGEGLMIGLLGSLIGLGFGFVVCFAAQNFGITMDPQVYYIDRLPVHLDATEFGLVGLSSAVVCLLATISPALLASKVRPLDAVRYD